MDRLLTLPFSNPATKIYGPNFGFKSFCNRAVPITPLNVSIKETRNNASKRLYLPEVELSIEDETIKIPLNTYCFPQRMRVHFMEIVYSYNVPNSCHILVCDGGLARKGMDQPQIGRFGDVVLEHFEMGTDYVILGVAGSSPMLPNADVQENFSMLIAFERLANYLEVHVKGHPYEGFVCAFSDCNNLLKFIYTLDGSRTDEEFDKLELKEFIWRRPVDGSYASIRKKLLKKKPSFSRDLKLGILDQMLRFTIIQFGHVNSYYNIAHFHAKYFDSYYRSHPDERKKAEVSFANKLQLLGKKNIVAMKSMIVKEHNILEEFALKLFDSYYKIIVLRPNTRKTLDRVALKAYIDFNKKLFLDHASSGDDALPSSVGDSSSPPAAVFCSQDSSPYPVQFR